MGLSVQEPRWGRYVDSRLCVPGVGLFVDKGGTKARIGHITDYDLQRDPSISIVANDAPSPHSVKVECARDFKIVNRVGSRSRRGGPQDTRSLDSQIDTRRTLEEQLYPANQAVLGHEGVWERHNSVIFLIREGVIVPS